jgi:hypothetical protein
MITREELMSRGGDMRDDLMERRAALAERAAHIREQFAENVDRDAVTMTAGLTLVSTGLALGITYLIRGRRGFGLLAMPVMLVFAGMTLLGNGAWHRRGVHIDAAEIRVREELATLDPFARAQVLKDMATEAVAPFARTAVHN